MKGVAWSHLMRLGLNGLRLDPDVFWNLTPVELMFLAGAADGPSAPTRETFNELASRFPDVAGADRKKEPS